MTTDEPIPPEAEVAAIRARCQQQAGDNNKAYADCLRANGLGMLVTSSSGPGGLISAGASIVAGGPGTIAAAGQAGASAAYNASPLDELAAVRDFFAVLGQPATWVRIGLVLGGAGLLVAGVLLIAGDVTDAPDKAAAGARAAVASKAPA